MATMQRLFRQLLVVSVIFHAIECTYILSAPIDLTWGFDNGTTKIPGSQELKFTRNTVIEKDEVWMASRDFCIGEHGGTHLNAPYQFCKEGRKVGDIPLADLIVEGITVDICKEVDVAGATAELTVNHLENWIKQHGEIPNHCVLLVRFGWSKYYGTKQYLNHNTTSGAVTFPGISSEAANWIKNTKKIVGVGVDTVSLDPGSNRLFNAHRILCSGNIYGLAELNIPAELPARNYTLLVMPMKLTEGTGAPTRIVAIGNKIAGL